MILFNWNKILEYSKYDAKLAVLTLKCLIGLKQATKHEAAVLARYFADTKLSKLNWIENPEGLYNNVQDVHTLFRYITIASYRVYIEYKLRNIAYVPTYMIDSNIDTLVTMRLLTIKEDKIYFKY